MAITDRTAAAPLIPEEVQHAIIQGTVTSSTALQIFRHVQMSRKQQRMAALSAYPYAYFVNGDTGLKSTTQLAWENKYLNAEEIAVILPVPDVIFDDIDYDFWAEAQPRITEAFGRVLDRAIFFGTDKPSAWDKSLVEWATGATTPQSVTRGTAAQAAGGIYGDFSALATKVESSGYDVNGVLASRVYKGLTRDVRSTLGETISPPAWLPEVRYPLATSDWPASTVAEAIVGDFSQGLIGVRQDVTTKILTESVIQDSDGSILFNLAQQDMTAIRVVARYAWATPNPYNLNQPTAAARAPYGVLVHA